MRPGQAARIASTSAAQVDVAVNSYRTEALLERPVCTKTRSSGVRPLNSRREPVWCPPRGPRRRSGVATYHMNRRISTEVHERNLLKAPSPALGRCAHRGGGGALVEGGAPVEA